MQPIGTKANSMMNGALSAIVGCCSIVVMIPLAKRPMPGGSRPRLPHPMVGTDTGRGVMRAGLSITLTFVMSLHSDPFFRTFHALRIKGFAKADVVAEVADLPLSIVDQHLADLQGREWAMFREARELWQLTPVGREEHRIALAEDVGHVHIAEQLHDAYSAFLGVNERFKTLCGDWQLRDSAPNDHSDAAYDAAVVEHLVALNGDVLPLVVVMGEVLARLAPYAPRLVSTCQRVVAGETKMFTGVMCGSYHDVWMELHEDLILTQGIDRSAEGSF